MTDEELREKVLNEVRPGWRAYPVREQNAMLRDADRAIALCREHYEAEIARLRRERDEAHNKAINAAAWEVETTARPCFADGLRGRNVLTAAVRALRKEEGDD